MAQMAAEGKQPSSISYIVHESTQKYKKKYRKIQEKNNTKSGGFCILHMKTGSKNKTIRSDRICEDGCLQKEEIGKFFPQY